MGNVAGLVLELAAAPRESLSRCVYSVGAFSPTADEIRARVVRAFPGAAVTHQTDAKRQAIVDGWPADVDDSAARRDWGFAPHYGEAQAFDEYLIPAIRQQYVG